MKRDYSFSFLLLPLAILIIFGSSLLIERSGVRYESSSSYENLQFLPQENLKIKDYFSDKPVEALVLYDASAPTGEREHVKTLLSALDSMQVAYDTFDVNSNGDYDLSNYQTVVVSFLHLEKIQEKILELVDWVADGGRVLISIRPEPSDTFSSIYRKLGIVSLGRPFVVANGIDFKTDILPGASGMSFGLSLFSHTSYPVDLEAETRIHIVSADENKTPILWEYDYQQGRFVFINSDQFLEKNSRGILGAAYSLLDDVFVYPVINSSVFFIDDFPSPIPEGSNEFITKEYNRDIQGFLINIWWPDLERISHQYNIKYTSSMIETYNDDVMPPFMKPAELARHQYFGSLLLNDGGELGFLGYNHVPLCLASDSVNQVFDYPGWPSTESMQLSLYGLYSFTSSLFPENRIITYVPPSNILCPSSRRWLPEVLPGLKVISGVYLPEPTGLLYEQEFSEAPDGIIEFPRVISGYEIQDYETWSALNELGLHYVNSHFVRPSEAFDMSQGEDKGWPFLNDHFNAYVGWLTQSAPGLRQMTASEGAMAVQRFARLVVKSESVNGDYHITLGNYYDDAWLMFRTSKMPQSVQGGAIVPVASNLYLINATDSTIIIKFME